MLSNHFLVIKSQTVVYKMLFCNKRSYRYNYKANYMHKDILLIDFKISNYHMDVNNSNKNSKYRYTRKLVKYN